MWSKYIHLQNIALKGTHNFKGERHTFLAFFKVDVVNTLYGITAQTAFLNVVQYEASQSKQSSFAQHTTLHNTSPWALLHTIRVLTLRDNKSP